MQDYLVDIITEGVGFGRAIVYNYANLNDNFLGVEEEIERFSLALKKAIDQLESIKTVNIYPNEDFIDAHILLLKDDFLIASIKEYITENKANASIAFSRVLDNYINSLKLSNNLYLKERCLDLSDIKERVIKNINNIEALNITGDIIIVTEELLPSMIIDSKASIKGIIAKKGGYTSHGVILCKAKEIPYVIIQDNDIKNDDLVMIDTRKRVVIKEPNRKTIDEYEYLEMNKELGDVAVRFDHEGIKVFANISNNAEIKKVLTSNFDGIGLYRSEFIFMNLDRPLSSDEQFEIYHEAVLKMGDKPIYFRTFDIGADKELSYLTSSKKGIENYKANPSLFEGQIKALIRANVYNNMKIMFPMIEKSCDFDYLKNWVLRIKEEMKNESIIEIGMMLETKSALENLNTFDSSDFFSLGTNDLTAQLYKISRGEGVNYHSYLHDLLDRLKKVVDYCNKHKKPLSICGELASIKNVANLLLKIGIRSFSVSVSSLRSLELAIKEHYQK